MSNLIRFNADSHWYLKDGSPNHDIDLRGARKVNAYASVTTIDKAAFPNPFLDKWKWNQLVLAASENYRQPHEGPEEYANRIYEISMQKATTAADFGKKLHDAIEKHPAQPSDELLPWWLNFDQWWKESGLVTIQSEVVLLEHDIGVAGRCDRICQTQDGVLVIPDWKTQDVKVDNKGKKTPAYYDSWARQLALYTVAYAKQVGMFPKVPSCKSLIIDSNKGGLIYEKNWTPAEIRFNYSRFCHGAWLFYSDKRPPYWPRGEWSVADIQLPDL